MLAVLAFVAAASMGADSDARDVAMSVLPNGASVTIAAPAYTRTVTASSYTLTGTSAGSGAVTWAASPSGSSGACTGTDSWSCVVTVTPDAVGEGVETITVTRGSATDTETLGFYVAGAHSCFLSQNVNGSYNVGLADLDAVSTWENVGTSALDVTQGVGAAKPTFRTSIVGGQPVVRCDGGDGIVASTASDWTFLNNGTDYTFENVSGVSAANPNNQQTIASTINAFTPTVIGFASFYDDRSAFSLNDRFRFLIVDNSGAAPVDLVSADDVYPAQKINLIQQVLDDDAGAGVDASQFCNGAACGTVIQSGGYSASAPAAPLTLCTLTLGASYLTGDIFRVLIYASALDSTQRGINKAVDEWALGGTLPVTP